MKVLTYTAARENLASTMDSVCTDREPVAVTLNRSQANAKRLTKAFASTIKGKAQERILEAGA